MVLSRLHIDYYSNGTKTLKTRKNDVRKLYSKCTHGTKENSTHTEEPVGRLRAMCVLYFAEDFQPNFIRYFALNAAQLGFRFGRCARHLDML